MAAIRKACPTRLTGVRPLLRSFRSPLMRVPGAKPRNRNAAWSETPRVGPISQAITSAVSGPIVGMAVRSTPIMRRSEVCSVRFAFSGLPCGGALPPVSPSSGSSGGLSGAQPGSPLHRTDLRVEEIVALQGLLERKQMLLAPCPLQARREGRRTRLDAPVAHRRQHLRVALPIDNRTQYPLTGRSHEV